MKTKWTHFFDMHSGGRAKEEPYEHIYIQAPIEEAKLIFYNRFGHNPERVTCTCCGEDYSISESDLLEQVTGYERGCKFDVKTNSYKEEPDLRYGYKKFFTIEQYQNLPNVLIIFDSDIKDDERIGEVPEEGYVWI